MIVSTQLVVSAESPLQVARAAPGRAFGVGVCSALLALGCSDPQGGTDVGNGAAVSIDLRGYEQTPESSAKSFTLGDGARIDELWMAVDRLRLRPGTNCGTPDGKIDVPNTLVADLIGSGVLGGAPSFAVEPGPFCRLQIGFHRLAIEDSPPGAPADLVGLSILMKGSRADGTPFTVSSRMTEMLTLNGTGGAFELPSGESPLFVAYELGAWMAALDLGTLGSGPIVVNDAENTDRLRELEKAVRASASLFPDQDRDGNLSASERAPDKKLAE